jgi:metaxin
MTSLSLPRPLRTFFAYFPLHTYAAIQPPSRFALTSPTLWIVPPRSRNDSPLSSDVECLKWQAYLALRGLTGIAVRCDISSDGALDERLPNLQIPPQVDVPVGSKGKLLPAHRIPEWVDERVGGSMDDLEGYRDEVARDESRAWVALLEGTVHAALVRDIQFRMPCRVHQLLIGPLSN